MSKVYAEAEIEGEHKILRIDAPFDESLVALRREGAKQPISARDLAYSRAHVINGKESTLNTRGGYTKSGYLYAANQLPIRATVSPLLDIKLAKQATQANREGRYFITGNTELYEQFNELAEKDKSRDPKDRRAIILPSRDSFQISPTQNPEVFANIFGDAGAEYLAFTGFNNLTFYPVSSETVNGQKGTLLTQEWLARLVDGNSNVRGDARVLGNDDAVRGVFPIYGEASARKNLPYTSQDLKVAERELDRLSKILQPKQVSNLRGLITKLRGK